MRWFKHDVDMHTDLKIQALIERHGITGYAVWNLCLELLGKEGKNGKLDGSVMWKEGLLKTIGWSEDIQKKTLEEILLTMADLKLICGKSIRYNNLYIPKFMQRADEWSTRISRETHEQHLLDKNKIDKSKIDKVMFAFIDRKGYKKDDPIHIKYLYQRNTKTIKPLLLLSGGDSDKVIDGMNWFADLCEKKQLSWTLETILKWFPDFLAKGKNVAEIPESLKKYLR